MPMISYHVTAVTCLFIVQEIKEKEKKRKIKSRKIDKKKRKSKQNIRVQVHHDKHSSNNQILLHMR